MSIFEYNNYKMADTNGTSRGFTLVEVLAATLLGALVALAAGAALQTVTKSREKADAYSELSGNGRYALGRIRDDLANVYRGTKSEPMYFVGTTQSTSGDRSDRLLFHAVVHEKQHGRETVGDMYELEYGLSKSDLTSGGVLWRRCGPVGKPAQNNVSRIAEHVSRIKFAYFDGDSWRGQWQEPEAVPLLVRVDLELSDFAGATTMTLSQVIAPAAKVGRWTKELGHVEEGTEASEERE